MCAIKAMEKALVILALCKLLCVYFLQIHLSLQNPLSGCRRLMFQHLRRSAFLRAGSRRLEVGHFLCLLFCSSLINLRLWCVPGTTDESILEWQCSKHRHKGKKTTGWRCTQLILLKLKHEHKYLAFLTNTSSPKCQCFCSRRKVWCGFRHDISQRSFCTCYRVQWGACSLHTV